LLETDVLILGSGSAGLFSALNIARSSKLRVLILTKKDRSESNTNYAQGGIAGVLREDDTFDAHIRDTLIAGAGLCHRDAVEILVREGPDQIRELMRIGAQFTTTRTGELHLGKEGGHSAPRIIHSRDLTGREVERALLDAVSAEKNITLLEDHYAVELLNHRHTSTKKRPTELECYGAYIYDEKKNKVIIVKARAAVIVATGGAGQVYLHTTNPLIATGDGIAMAYRAGAKIGNMEFIQFHPTTLFKEGANSFLITEAVRGAGGILRNLAGERFMKRYDRKRLELAPRDIVARAIDAELKRRGDTNVLLDISHLGDKARHEFPNIYKVCRKFGIDITKDPIPVVPAAHYSCGGIVTDLEGRTSVRSLYAAGEAAMTGVHGANRLASNSLLETLVFAKRASEAIIDEFRTNGIRTVPHIRPWDDSGTENAEEWVVIEHDRKEIQQLMWDYVGIVRSTYRLERALRRLQVIRKEIREYYARTKVTVPLLELRNIAETSLLIVKSALRRKESRGLHYMLDYPTDSDYYGKRDTIIKRKIL
jgi:L-aspartate oxidase